MQNQKKIYVGNLPWSVRDEQLKELFSSFGEIVDAVVITFRDTGKSKGFGFVEFADEKAATKAVSEMDQKEVEGRNIIVKIARPPKEE